MEDSENSYLTPRERAALERNPELEISSPEAKHSETTASGVGGWLLVAILVLMIGSPFSSFLALFAFIGALLASNNGDFSVLMGAMPIVVITVTLGSAALSGTAAYFLLRGEGAQNLAIAARAVMIKFLLFDVAYSLIIDPKLLVRSVFITLALIFYLKKSKRVRATYV